MPIMRSPSGKYQTVLDEFVEHYRNKGYVVTNKNTTTDEREEHSRDQREHERRKREERQSSNGTTNNREETAFFDSEEQYEGFRSWIMALIETSGEKEKNKTVDEQKEEGEEDMQQPTQGGSGGSFLQDMNIEKMFTLGVGVLIINMIFKVFK